MEERKSNGNVCDVPNCKLGYDGEDVSFDSILKKYGLDRLPDVWGML
jgi:hypothetical protein